MKRLNIRAEFHLFESYKLKRLLGHIRDKIFLGSIKYLLMENPHGTNNRGLITVVATILTTKIIQYFDLSQTMYGLIYSGIIELYDSLQAIEWDWNRLWEVKDHLIDSIDPRLLYLGLIPVLWWCSKRIYYWFKRRWNKKPKKKLSTMVIYNPAYVKDISEYIRLCPENFKNINSFKVGDPRLISLIALNGNLGNNYEFSTNAYSRAPKENHQIIIDDQRFDVKGHMYWKVHVEKITKKSSDGSVDEDFNLKFIEISLESEEPTAVENYVDKIRDYINNLNSKKVTQYHVKILTDNNSYDTTNDLQIIYSGPPPDLLQREKQFIKTFFHPSRDRLWEMIKKIQFDQDFFYRHGQAPQIGLLLHGPPGTGKSTFAYRIGMALNRHIVSVDIRTIRYKSRLWQIIKRPRVHTPMTSQDCIFIFDEFDLTVRDLYYRDRFNNNLIHMWINKMDNEFKRKEEEMNEAEKEDKESSDKDKEREEDLKSRKMKMLSTRKKRTAENRYPSLNLNHEEIQLTDLLEVFQGPVPIEGLITIATTNHYEEIEKMCPALFRPGRLTPIHFGYAIRETIHDISLYYFGEIPTYYIPEKSRIPTSKIIEMVIEAKMHIPNDFVRFSEALERELDRVESAVLTIQAPRQQLMLSDKEKQEGENLEEILEQGHNQEQDQDQEQVQTQAQSQARSVSVSVTEIMDEIIEED